MTTFQKIIIPLVVLLLGASFYWFQYRPTKIKQICTADSFQSAHEVLVQRANDLFDKAETGLENGTITNDSGKSPEEMKAEYLEKIEGSFDQSWFNNSYAACLHSKGL